MKSSGSKMTDIFQHVERSGGDSLKWNRYVADTDNLGRDILPMWVADMDFASPPEVIQALNQRVAHGVFGYGIPWPSLIEVMTEYLESHYGWSIEPEWIVWLPGLNCGLNVACRAVGGDVITGVPIYPPFLKAPHYAGQALHRVPLKLEGGIWQWDWPLMEAAAEKAQAQDAKNKTDAQHMSSPLLLLCHPHNPVGRSWKPEELRRLADFCEQHQLVVCSDEIHCGLVLDKELEHKPFALFSDYAAQHSITFMAPSKTYNVPGLGCAFAIVPNRELRRKFTQAMRGIMPDPNILGLVACEAAYRDGEPWRQLLLETLRKNRDRIEKAVEHLPRITMQHVEATYLAWIDVREMQLEHPARYFESYGLGLLDGADFGAPGWVRLNFACAPQTLECAIERLSEAVKL